MPLFRPALILLVVFTLITGILYPLFTTLIAQGVFHWQANGSLLTVADKVRGSALIGQSFDSKGYFFSRPSATANFPYNTLASGGSNLAISNAQLQQQMLQRSQYLKQTDPRSSSAIPIELLTASASGLDPQLSLDGITWQIPRILQQRQISLNALQHLIDENTDKSIFSFLSTPVVNVLRLNMALDRYCQDKDKS